MILSKLMIPVVGALSFLLFACDPVSAHAGGVGYEISSSQNSAVEIR